MARRTTGPSTLKVESDGGNSKRDLFERVWILNASVSGTKRDLAMIVFAVAEIYTPKKLILLCI